MFGISTRYGSLSRQGMRGISTGKRVIRPRTYTVTLSATNAAGTGTQTLTITVNPQ